MRGEGEGHAYYQQCACFLPLLASRVTLSLRALVRIFFMFWSFQPQTDSRSADIRKPLMPLDKHGNTLAGCGRTTEVFCLSPCGSGGASSSYFFFFHFLLLVNRQEGEGGDKTQKIK